MRRNEKVVLVIIAVVISGVFLVKAMMGQYSLGTDPGMPFYSNATEDVKVRGNAVYHVQNCKECHMLFGSRDLTLAVPAPALDGIGSLRDEQWLFNYFSAENPQAILPSRLKLQYRMPSYANLPEEERRVLAQYIASLKVQDWYLNDVKKAEYEKLTGKPMPATETVAP